MQPARVGSVVWRNNSGKLSKSARGFERTESVVRGGSLSYCFAVINDFRTFTGQNVFRQFWPNLAAGPFIPIPVSSIRSKCQVGTVALVLADEVHTIGEERGATLEVILTRMKMVSRSPEVSAHTSRSRQ